MIFDLTDFDLRHAYFYYCDIQLNATSLPTCTSLAYLLTYLLTHLLIYLMSTVVKAYSVDHTIVITRPYSSYYPHCITISFRELYVVYGRAYDQRFRFPLSGFLSFILFIISPHLKISKLFALVRID